MSISQFFVLSSRGDTVIFRDYRQDLPKNTPEIFLRKVKLSSGEAPPFFNIEGISYIYGLKKGLYFVLTTRFNVSPTVSVELINRIVKLFNDYCGSLTEQTLRENYLLLYELLDEVIDFGYPQDTSTELIKTYVQNIPTNRSETFRLSSKSVSAAAALGSVAQTDRNELFVDCVEKLNIVFDPKGSMLTSSIDGSIILKSFLQDNPLVRLQLNENIYVNTLENIPHNSVVLDDCNFHESVNLNEFETNKLLTFYPPDGEFIIMNYRITKDYAPPFRIYPHIEQEIDTKIEIILKIKSELPKEKISRNVGIVFHAPSSTASCHLSIPNKVSGQQYDYKEKHKRVVWMISQMEGQSEHILRCVFSLDIPASIHFRKEIGPFILSFEIPDFNVSGFNIKTLQIEEKNPKNKPKKWMRVLTFNSSYINRL